MTDEESFQAALDANPDDHTIRLIFADWLQEQEPPDPRAEGYRWMGESRLRSIRIVMSDSEVLWLIGNDGYEWRSFTRDKYGTCLVPKDVYRLIDDKHPEDRGSTWKYRRNRVTADNGIALAFAKLPKKRRAELLGTLTPA